VPDAKYYSVKSSNLIKELKDITDNSANDPILYVTSNSTEEISILADDKSVIAKGIVSIDKNYSGEVALNMAEQLSLGNSAANINNNGIAVGNTDGYIYYVNSSDKEKLYKQGIGGGYNRLILEDKPQYINESGDWIYYSNYSDGGALYRIKKDGTSKEKLLYDKAAYITIAGQDIYYSNHSDGGKLYRVKKDMSDAKKGADGYLHGNIVSTSYGDNSGKGIDEVAYINVVGNWIYYSNYSDGHKPYVISKDGTYRGKLSENYADCLQVQGDWIYFTTNGGTISKINKNQNSLTIPIKATASLYNKGYHINVHGDWIFYSNAEDKGKLYKINTDGSGTKVKLADESVGYINIVGDWIYFNTTGGKSYRLPVTANGTEKPELLGTSDITNKIAEIQDVYVTVDYADVDKSIAEIENKYIPDKVSATMSDNTMQQLVVSWDTKNVVVKDGVRTYSGSVIGYNKTIKLIMTIPSQMLNDTNTISIYKNGNKNDIVIVEGDNTDVSKIRIAEGDVITIFDKDGKQLGTGTVGKDGKATVSKLSLNDVGDSFFIKVKRGTKAPSNSTEVRLHNVPLVKSTDVLDNDSVGVGVDSRDISINKWTQAYFDTFKKNTLDNAYKTLYISASGTQAVTLTGLDGLSRTITIDGDKVRKGQKIYVVPTKTAFDMTNLSYLDIKSFTDTSWNIAKNELKNSDGTYYSKDSLGTALKSGNYDAYVSNSFIGLAAPDISGKQPVVYEEIANSLAAAFTMTAEGVPAKPTIQAQTVQGSKTGVVKLDKVLAQGETAWLIPVAIIDKYNLRGWRADMGTNPLQDMINDVQDVVYKSYTSPGTTMDSPKGDVSQLPKDVEYKLFISNSIGISPESDNKIIVDNKSPDARPVAPDVSKPNVYDYYVGDTINVISDEKAKVYIVAANVTASTVADLEDAVRNKNALSISHSGSNIKVPITKSETLIDFIEPTSNTNNIDSTKEYKVIGVDLAGNISSGFLITITRHISELYDLYWDARARADALGTAAPIELLNSIKKCEGIFQKVSVKQSEINAMYDELLTNLNRLTSSFTLNSTDKKITLSGDTITLYQMTISKLRSKLTTLADATVKFYDKDGNLIPTEAYTTTFTTDGMKVVAEYGNLTPLSYTFYVNAAIDISTKDELLYALNVNTHITSITLTQTPVPIIINEPININRKLSIEGSTGATTVIQFGSNGILNNTVLGELSLKNITFTGGGLGRTQDVINNTGVLTIDSCKFTGFRFTDNKSVVRSIDGAKLVMTNANNYTTFSLITSDSNTTFSYVYIGSGTSFGTKVDKCIFTGTTSGKNVKGIMIEGNTIGSQIQISNNTFTGFISNTTGSMAIPVYVLGGSISMSNNTINTSESGIFIDVNKLCVIGVESIMKGSGRYDVAGTLIKNANSKVANNYFGDIMIGLLEDGKIPTIYYNSTTTPTIANMTVTGGTLDITKNNATDIYQYKVTDSLNFIVPPQKGTIASGYTLYDDANKPTGLSGKYLTVVQVDSTGKIQTYRQTYIP
jgi:hypothetical protein